MKTYIYSETAPVSGVTLADGKEVILFPGKRVELPEDLPYVKALVKQRYLKPAPVEPTPVAQPKKEKK